jgi:hypothetical protein
MNMNSVIREKCLEKEIGKANSKSTTKRAVGRTFWQILPYQYLGNPILTGKSRGPLSESRLVTVFEEPHITVAKTR